ncbi:DUF456 family protein [Algiphilus sp. W345]|uniref:DUF456 family protein n=1 Tax=Banduia mediterranea TaxID=3075609 RepID=A0ABU2WFP3_9GAMM|nr:DUF456 family protein [Algiphilus sp. W345]MDT0496345.1 DUF456 family protein [Algiphilus sp. W345]
MEFVPILWWGLAVLLIGGGLVGTIYPLLPGVPMIFIGMWIGAWVDGYARVGTKTLVFLGVLTAFSVILDFIASALGARRVGASRQAVTGALIGSIAGMFFGLPGLLIGPFVGAVVGELVARGGLSQAMNVGVATWIGLLLGALAKLAISLVMIGVFVSVFLLY